MLDPVTLDQLRALLAVVDSGSFSAAARRLKRVQSAISTAMSNLEGQLGVTLWDRSTKVATLTDEGRAVVAAARRVILEIDSLKRLATGMAGGLEASVSLCVDALFPLSALVHLCASFAKEFPAVNLRVDTQLMSAVAARVLDGSATLGVASPLGVVAGLERRVLAKVLLIPVVGAGHPLAKERGAISTARMSDVVQIVLSERSETGVADQGVLSPRTWRIAELHTKHALIRAGLGWGNLPEHVVREDLRTGELVRIRPEAWTEDEHTLLLSAIYRSGAAFGPAHLWVLERMGVLCAEEVGVEGPRRRRGRKSS
jgi:DNA-binding transcriptional LysR family regulator